MTDNVTALRVPDIGQTWISAEEAAAKLVERLGKRAEPIPDGLYFDLAETTYHRDLALGSTDMSRLFVPGAREPAAEATALAEYWFESGYNPRPLRDTDEDEGLAALIRGQAIHCHILYGPEVFAARYGRAELNGSTKDGKRETEAIEKAGKRRLKAQEYDRVQEAVKYLRGKPSLAEAFEGGRAEVSMFWTPADGVRRKARFDYLKPRAVVDLKTLNPRRREAFRRSCLFNIKAYNYPLQAEHYRQGREQIARFMREGRIFGDHDPAWLREVAAIGPDEWAWTWIFWRSKGAPLSYGFQISPANAPIRDVAAVMLDQAARLWQFGMNIFGPDQPWLVDQEIEELSIDDLRFWGE